MEGEDWFVGFDEVFESMPEGSEIDFDGPVNSASARVVAHRQGLFSIEIDLGRFASAKPRIAVADGFLVISADKSEYARVANQNYLQRGISAQGFRRSFQLGKDLRVIDSDISQGILRIEMEQAAQSIEESVTGWTRAG